MRTTIQALPRHTAAANVPTATGTRNSRVHADVTPGWTGRSTYVSQSVLDAAADAEYAARTHGGWKTPVCPTCYTRRSANGTCNCG